MPGGAVAAVLDYAVPLAMILGIPAAGAILGVFVPLRKRWLVAPIVLLAIGAWIPIWFGDDSDYYDIGRDGALILEGMFGLIAIALWAGGVTVGRFIRRVRRTRRSDGFGNAP